MDRSELIRDWNYQRTPEPPGEYWRTITADRFGGPDVEWQLWRGATGWT